MISSDIVLGIFFLFQTCIGFIGNSLLFMLYMYIFFVLPQKKKPVDVVLAYLTLVNALKVIFTGVPYAMSSFGIRPVMDDIGCKIVVYIQRVTRGISLYTTSLQSAFQAVTITPSNSKWAWLKNKISTFIQPSLLFICIINMIIYTEVILRTVANRNLTDNSPRYHTSYCKLATFNYQIAVSFLSAVFIRDLLLVSVMMCNSIYMMYTLFRHRKTAQHVRSNIYSSHSSPENKATYIILALVSCFVFFYWTNTFLTVYLTMGNNKNSHLDNFNNLVALCYPTICPLLLIKNENRICRLTFTKRRIGIFSS